MLQIVICQCSWKYKLLIFWSNNSIAVNILARVNKTKHKNKLGYYDAHFLKEFPLAWNIFSTPSLSVCMFLKWVSCSVQFSRSVVSYSLRPHEPQHARPPCPSPAPRVYPNSCPSSQWCHPTISSSVIPFSSCPQSFPASVSQFICSVVSDCLCPPTHTHTRHTHTHTHTHTSYIIHHTS